MDLAETEAEISGDFRQLSPNRQDCVLETARALSWAAQSIKNQPEAATGKEPWFNRPIEEGGEGV